MNRILRRACFWMSQSRPLQNDTTALRKQLGFRANNLGVRELDLIVGHWAQINLSKLDHAQLLRFHGEVLQHETPQLVKKILGQVEISSEEPLIQEIRAFALDSSVSKIDNL